MKKALLLITTILLVQVSLAAQNISIGAWNIQWLGTPDKRSGCAVNIRQTSDDIAEYISGSGVDILALEEIGDTDSSSQDRTNDTLDRAFDVLNSSNNNEWKYLLFAKRSQSQTTQLTGIAWNEKRVRKVGDPYRLQMTTTGSDFDRWATAIKFKFDDSKNDVVVIPVHLKANVGGNASVQRRREAIALVNALDKVRERFDDEDIIILGDTNILKNTEAAVTKIKSAGFVDLNNSDRSTTVGGNGAPFDRAFVRGDQPEFSIHNFDVFKPSDANATEFGIKYSDHYMVRIVVRVMNDDD